MWGRWKIEDDLRDQGFACIAGVDEAGRGPLAGPVVAAAVILPERCRLPGLHDSKLVAPDERERLYELIVKRAITLGVGMADAKMIDRLNVLGATKWAMREALAQLAPRPDMVLVDGRELPGDGAADEAKPMSQRAIIGGDHLCGSIAAASIVAKVLRDRMMRDLDGLYPGYGFGQHKGYGTPEHQARLAEMGPCPEHRLSFAPVRDLFQCRLPLETSGPSPLAEREKGIAEEHG